MSKRYYLLQDTSVQWFTWIAESFDDNEENIRQIIEIPSRIRARTLQNILDRPPNYLYKRLNAPFVTETQFTAWYISQYEYERLREITEYYPQYLHYLKLTENL